MALKLIIIELIINEKKINFLKFYIPYNNIRYKIKKKKLSFQLIHIFKFNNYLINNIKILFFSSHNEKYFL